MISTRKKGAKGLRTPEPTAFLLHRILVPVDFSPPSRKAVLASVQLVQRFKTKLALIYVTGPRGRTGSLGALEMAGLTTDPRRPAREKLTEFAQKEVPAELDTKLFVESGAAYREIATVAAEWNADLIILPTHGYTGLTHALLGSTAERVVRHAPCPVLVLRGREKRGEKVTFSTGKIRSIVVTTDFSENSQSALPHAIAWAREFGARLTLVYVVPETLPADVSHLGLILEIKNLAKAAQPRLVEFRNRYLPPDLKVETLVLTGTPDHEICEAARKADADLIVMGSHGHTGFLRLMIGSVAERVVQHAPCPVLIAHQKPIP